ncbi:hypothetical protein JTB14_016341 [Gonioctena quinquepunctata]|nr:hypothetical protein JTB14_016341 [Gonioctena quinquepunctata]
MGAQFNRWTVLKVVEVILVATCLIFKRVTDDEASRLYLYLQKISREWSLLNNITWSRVGAAVADTTYGGYLIITAALLIGHITGEVPTPKRIMEYILLGIGTILFVVMGSLSFAALDSVPPDLIDNAAIVGTISLVTAALFLLDMGGPKGKKPSKVQPASKKISKPTEPKSISQQVYDIERELEKSERKHLDTFEPKPQKNGNGGINGIKNGKMANGNGNGNGNGIELEKRSSKGYLQMKDDFPRRYGIYGRDLTDGNETDETELQLPPEMEPHSPVWSQIRKGQYGKYDIISSRIVLPKQKEQEYDPDRPPSRPGEPGFVQYTAQHWGEGGGKTPRHSPTEV